MNSPAAKTAFNLHIPNKPFLFREYAVQQNTSPHWLPYHLGEAVVISTLQEPPAYVLLCYPFSKYWGG